MTITPQTFQTCASYCEAAGLSVVAVLAIVQYAIGSFYDFCEYCSKRKKEIKNGRSNQ